MKAKDLMIGDWINWCETVSNMMGDYDELWDKKQLSINDFVTTVKEDWDDMTFDEFVKPIPIMEEILKNNEFIEINDDEKWYKRQLLAENDFVGLKKCEEEYWMFAVVVFPNLIKHIFIKYLHELQHALRLVGLSEIADNLKV